MGPISHQLAKMKAFIVISFTLASLVAAAPDSSSGSGSDRFLGDLIHNVITNVFGEHGHGESSFGSGSMDDVGSWDMPSSWDMGSDMDLNPLILGIWEPLEPLELWVKP